MPDLPQSELPTEEEHVRQLVRERFPPPTQLDSGVLEAGTRNLEKDASMKTENRKLQLQAAEESWLHVPVDVRRYLAAVNAIHMEKKLQLLLDESHHPSAGFGSISRSSAGVCKTFNMWKHNFVAAIDWRERVAVNAFFVVLAFNACYPDIVAGFLGERSYNQRSIGNRIVTLCQMFFLWIFPFHSLWLLFNWSVERLLGAFLGNLVYALVAIVPSIRASYKETWFRTMMLVLSVSWQAAVQFFPVRDYLVRLLTRRQMRALRKQSKSDDHIDWTNVDEMVKSELVSHQTFAERQAMPGAIPKSWDEVPIKVRAERYIQFTATFELGRYADQLVGLLKDDLEGIINTYEDYMLSAPPLADRGSPGDYNRGHVEPRLPKLLFVFFDVAIFAYVCYSFWTQPFTFNTVVAYSTVVIFKQTIVAFKRYQTIKSARRLFTNMVSINILGMLLVSLPVTIDRDVLADDGNMVALTLAMVFATLFLSEPIAPLLLACTEKGVAAVPRLASRLRFQDVKKATRGTGEV